VCGVRCCPHQILLSPMFICNVAMLGSTIWPGRVLALQPGHLHMCHLHMCHLLSARDAKVPAVHQISSSDQFIRSVHQIILHAMRSEGMRSEGHSIQQPPRIKLGSTHPNNAWSKPHPEIRRRQPSITLPATFSRTVAPSFGTPLDPPGTFWPHSRLQATHRSDQKSLR